MIKDIIICDLDGTLADITHRLHFITPPKCLVCNGTGEMADRFGPASVRCTSCCGKGVIGKKGWGAFHAACVDDTLIQTTAITVKILTSHFMYCRELWITSARCDSVRPQTEEWLSRMGVNYKRLIMRKVGDHIPDYMLKRSWLMSGLIPRERVWCAFDDRQRVVDMWRSEGLTCYQVARGDF